MCHKDDDLNRKEWADIAEPAKSKKVKNQNDTYNIRKEALGPNGER